MIILEWGVVLIIGLLFIYATLLTVKEMAENYWKLNVNPNISDILITLAIFLSGLSVIHFAWVHRAMEVSCTFIH